MAYLDNIRTFIRVYELGNMSSAARDMRISAAVASARISQLEEHLGVRLFQRTTRMLNATEQGNIFYPGARKILDAVDEAEAEVNEVTLVPRGILHVSAPLGVGRRLIAPEAAAFRADYPLIKIRLRLSDRKIDLAMEGLDVAFFLGIPEDSSLRIRKIADCERVLCASPDYIAARGEPDSIEALRSAHDCLNLRYPGAPEFRWPLQTKDGPKRVEISGPFECDDGDILTNWALQGQGIIMKPLFEVSDYIKDGLLVPVLRQHPPVPIQMACLYSHRRKQDPKARLFIDFMVARMAQSIGDLRLETLL
ncbi:LysR family transcriptional regulator [Pseudorhodobacter turbinis]|uniref:LysR family transcriptional regulator n=1 Tax=Pseudorhodobacter turbinis TaxID=2500533 RepID=A0A4P8EF42_9RHOB|nr:LysR family transcriptional regulator [Pseudorhodobacter turbinis]QCO55711.1 LysR family transcriptional regulator [Pseudorhodobacter turbinis]